MTQTTSRPATATAVRAPAGRWPWPVAWLLIAGLAGLTLWSAPAPMMAPWDVFILLDGGYRITEGQIPHADFSTPVGPLVYGLVASGMGLQDVPSLAAVGYGNLLFLVIATLLAALVTRRRLPALYAAGFTAFIAVIVVSVRPLGYSPSITTYAMLYNRYGWVLYATLLVLVLLRPAGVQTARSLAGHGLLLGGLLGLLFFTKISFFVVGVVAVGVGWALGTLPRRMPLLVAIPAAFGLVWLTVWSFLGVRITDYLADIGDAAQVQGATHRLSMLAHSIYGAAPVGALTIGVLAGVVVLARRRGEPLRPVWRLVVAVAFAGVSTVLIAAGNAPENSDLPALVVAPLLLIAHFRPWLPTWAGGELEHGSLPKSLVAALAVLLAAATGPIVAKDALALGESAFARGYVADPPAGQRFDSPRLRDFVVPADSQWQTAYRTAHQVPAMINQGLGLVRKHADRRDTVFTLALTDPFSYALELVPSSGTPLWWDLGFSFDRTSYPTAERILGDADWVMIPRLVAGQGCCQETVEFMRDVYGGYLDQRFRQVDNATDWVLLGRIG